MLFFLLIGVVQISIGQYTDSPMDSEDSGFDSIKSQFSFSYEGEGL